MIKYKCRQAIHTKIVLEYCTMIGFSVPENYQHFINLCDETPIGFYTVTNLLNLLERNTDNQYFSIDLMNYFQARIVKFTESHIDPTQTNARKLANFINYYNYVSDLKWNMTSQPNNICLIANRTNPQHASKYDDLFLYVCASRLFGPSSSEKDSLSIKLPFERAFYGKSVDIFTNVQFNNQDMEVCVKKGEHDLLISNSAQEAELTTIERVEAAANNIHPQKLDLESLSYTLGMSPRNLQRSLKEVNSSPKKIINKVKINLIKKILKQNRGCIKRTAYECGYSNLASFSRFFYSTTGTTPTEYSKFI